MKLSHFSAAPVTDVRSMPQRSEPFMKPMGLWVSVDGQDDWPSWCVAEEYGIQSLTVRHVVKLHPGANILLLATADAVRRFSNEYADPVYRRMSVRWADVARLHQGIIIAPYQWECRFPQETNWYYSWDCASGCIWDADAIESVTVDPDHKASDFIAAIQSREAEAAHA